MALYDLTSVMGLFKPTLIPFRYTLTFCSCLTCGVTFTLLWLLPGMSPPNPSRKGRKVCSPSMFDLPSLTEQPTMLLENEPLDLSVCPTVLFLCVMQPPCPFSLTIPCNRACQEILSLWWEGWHIQFVTGRAPGGVVVYDDCVLYSLTSLSWEAGSIVYYREAF